MKPIFLENRLAFIACDDESYCEDLGIDVPTWDDEEPIEVEIDIHISKHEE